MVTVFTVPAVPPVDIGPALVEPTRVTVQFSVAIGEFRSSVPIDVAVNGPFALILTLPALAVAAMLSSATITVMPEISKVLVCLNIVPFQ